MIILGDFNLGPEENGKNKQLNSLDMYLVSGIQVVGSEGRMPFKEELL